MFDFGLRIKELRQKRGMSQEALGRRINRSKSVICSYENNLKIPPLDVLTDIAAVFNVSLDYLVGIDKNQMVSVEGLSNTQRALIETILFEFHDKSSKASGLTQRQQEILGGLMQEFSKK